MLSVPVASPFGCGRLFYALSIHVSVSRTSARVVYLYTCTIILDLEELLFSDVWIHAVWLAVCSVSPVSETHAPRAELLHTAILAQN